MKTIILLMTCIIVFSCYNKENSEVDLIRNSIEDNIKRANKMSNPMFSRDSLKIDYKFRSNSYKKNTTDSNLLQVVEDAQIIENRDSKL
jgi:hypothetical protein